MALLVTHIVRCLENRILRRVNTVITGEMDFKSLNGEH